VGPPDSLGWSPAQWTIKVAHEVFHVLSARRGSAEKIRSLNIGASDDPSWQLDFPFPYDDINVMRLIHLEGYLIFLAMESPEKDPGVLYNAGSSLEALEVNKAFLRSTTGDAKAGRYAMFQESEEGAGRYTEFRMAELAARPEYEPVRGFAALERNVSYAALWEDQYKNARFVVKHAGRAVKTRTVFYYLGAGKCLLLDRIDPDWKDSFFAPDVWLDDLMARAVGARTTLTRIEVGAAAPDFELKALDGKVHSLRDYRGHVVLLAFWQWWCPPCLIEMPHLQALQDGHREDGLVVLGVSDRVNHTARTKIQEVLAKTGTSYPALIDPTGGVLRDYGVNSYPTTVLIGRDGIVRWVDFGFPKGREDVIEQQVSTALKGGGNSSLGDGE
jgi:peroxiredoxin